MSSRKELHFDLSVAMLNKHGLLLPSKNGIGLMNTQIGFEKMYLKCLKK